MSIARDKLSQGFRERLLRLCEGGVFACAAGLLLGQLGTWHWMLELFSHFRWQYCVALLTCSLGFALLGARRRSAASFIAGVALCVVSLPTPSIPHAPETQPEGFHILSYNILRNNPEPQSVVEYLLASEADLIFLMEVDMAWLEALRPLEGKWPHVIRQPRSGSFGFALYSRVPFEDTQLPYWGDAMRTSACIRISALGGELTFIGTHPPPPTSERYAHFRNSHISELATFIHTEDFPMLIVAGDFNATPWSPIMKSLLSESGLKNIMDSHWIGPTWSRGLPAIAIPIDHVLYKGALTPVRAWVDEAHGSDHNPLNVVFAPSAHALKTESRANGE